MPALLRSSTARFFALVFVIQLVSAGALLLYIRHVAARELDRKSQAAVLGLRDDLIAGWRQGGRAALDQLVAERLQPPGPTDAVILLADARGRRLAGNLAAWPPVIAGDPARWTMLTLYRERHARPERMGLMATRLPDGTRLLAGEVVEDDLRVRRLIGEAMLAALLLAVPLALLGAMVATRVVTARIGRIAETAEEVADGDLTRRVAVSARDRDAFADLARAINEMLARIETLVGELRVVTDSLAHDLRAPLTRLRATIDRAQRDTDDEVALAALDRVGHEAETLLAMLSTALQISRAEAGIGRDRFVTVDLGGMVRDLVEMYGPLAEEAGFTLEAAGGGRATVHRELLGQALANLIDNAMKYGQAGGHIRVAVWRESARRVALRVDDDGPGIPEAARGEALRRFGRLDAARGAGGAGLGLALAAAVARLHGGDIALSDNAPGLAVTITLDA